MMSSGGKRIAGWYMLWLLSAVMMITPGPIYAEDCLDIIEQELRSGDWRVRLAAVSKLEKRSDEKALNVLLGVADTWTEYWPVKVKAIQLLGEAGYTKAVGLLLSIFTNPFLNWECPSIKSYTATALGNFKGNIEIVDTLIEGMTDDELLIREASIQSLGKIGDTKAVPYLIRLLGDRSTAIRLSVIQALSRIGDPRIIPDIQGVLEYEADSVVRSEALGALKRLHRIGNDNRT